jgi:CheY-like chemotaxis protein
MQQSVLTVALAALRESASASAGRARITADVALVPVMPSGHSADAVRLTVSPLPTASLEPAGNLDMEAVRVICEAHGGRFIAGDAGEAGAVVMELPIAAAEQAGSAATARGKKTEPEPARTVLIVDDDPAIRRFLERAVGLNGRAATSVASSVEAVERASDPAIGLVLCDQRLAAGTGIDLYRTVAQRRPDLARRFVLMTGDVDSDDVRAFAADSDGAILPKPFDLAAIGRLLERYPPDE